MRKDFEYYDNILSLDPDTGFLYWKIPGKGRKRDKPAGSADRRGYITLTIEYDRVRAHNIVWLLWTGKWPIGELDHRDHNTSNNRPSNLRDTTKSGNNYNRKVTNKYGCPGIFQMKTGLYRSMLNTTCLGYFAALEDAIEARHNAEDLEELIPEFENFP